LSKHFFRGRCRRAGAKRPPGGPPWHVPPAR